MAKGFMIFVEGGDVPRVLHPDWAPAWAEAKRLSTNNPYKEVTLTEFHYTFLGGQVIEKRIGKGQKHTA